MDKLIKIIEEGKMYVMPEKQEEWKALCEALYNKNHLNEVAVEIVEDSVKTMGFLNEGKYDLEEIIKRVGRSWEGGISFCLLTLIVEKFSINNERFKVELKELQEKNKNSKKIEGIFKKMR